MLEESKQVADNMAEADRNHVLRFVEEQETLKSHLDNIYVLGKVVTSQQNKSYMLLAQHLT